MIEDPKSQEDIERLTKKWLLNSAYGDINSLYPSVLVHLKGVPKGELTIIATGSSLGKSEVQLRILKNRAQPKEPMFTSTLPDVIIDPEYRLFGMRGRNGQLRSEDQASNHVRSSSIFAAGGTELLRDSSD